MAKATGFINAFTAGELGPDCWERSDLVQHAKGMAPGENLLVLTTGPAASRGGFWDRGAAKIEASAGRVVRFARSQDDGLLLEFYDLGFRVFSPLGDVLLEEVVTPWTAAQLAGLWFKQVGDVLYVTSRDGLAPYVIERFSNTEWTVAAFEHRDGPWLVENTDRTITLAADGIVAGSSVSLTAAGGNLFEAEHVGSRFRLRAQSSGAGVGAWTSGFDVLIDFEMAYSDGNIYRTTTVAADNKTGTNPPVHDHGEQYDGGMAWAFMHEGSGIVEITAVGGPTSATATVIGTMLPTLGNPETTGGTDGFRQVLDPADDATQDFPATSYWAEQAFSEVRGWPTALAAQHEERLVFAAPSYRPSTAWFTRTAGFGPAYGDFKPGKGTGQVVADDAVRLVVGDSGAPIHWIVSMGLLIAGTSDAEFALIGADYGDPVTPDGHGARRLSGFGVAPIAPVIVQGPPLCLLFVTRAGDVIRELRVGPDLTTEPGDATLLADHLRARGFAELAWQHPDEVLWARLADGGLAAFTFHQAQEVRAWTTMSLGGDYLVESIASVPAGDDGDVLWALVTRGEGETLQRRLWRLARRSEGMFLDGAERYTGVAVTAVSGLDHLEGETVQILGAATAGGAFARQPDRVVSATSVGLATACEDVIAGLGFTVRWVSLPLDLQGVASTIHRNLRTTHATVTLSCVEARVGDGKDAGWATVRQRPPEDLAAPLVKRINRRVAIGAGTEEERDARVYVEAVGPWDLVVRALRIEGEVQP